MTDVKRFKAGDRVRIKPEGASGQGEDEKTGTVVSVYAHGVLVAEASPLGGGSRWPYSPDELEKIEDPG